MDRAPQAAAEKVGVRDLKDHLSRYLAAVSAGGEVIVTDHNRPVARLVPVDRRAGVLEELVARGEAAAPRPGARRAPKPIAAKGSVSDLVAHQRR